MTSRRRLFLLIAVLVVITANVMAITLSTLYQVAFEQQRKHLVETVQSQARLIEAIERFDAQYIHSPEGAFDAGLSQIREANQNFEGLGKTGEFALARLEGDQMVFLLSQRSGDQDIPLPVPFSGALAEPMRLALSGKSGTVVGPDYRGVTVLAAYEPLAVEGHTLGLVAKIDLVEVQAPFIRAGLLAGASGLALSILGSLLFRWIGEPLILELEAREKWLSATLGSIGDAVISTDAEGHVSFLNPVAEALTGWRTEDARNRPLEDVFKIADEETGQRIENPIRAVLQEGLTVGVANHTALVALDGTRWPIAESGAPIRDDRGALLGAVLVFRDITHVRQAEERLRESEERYRALSESSPMGVFQTDENGRVVYLNARWCAITGMPEQEALGWGWSSALHPEDKPRVLEEWTQCLEEKRDYDGEFRFVRPDGEIRWVHARTSPIQSAAGDVIGHDGANEDITERKRAEGEQARLRDRLEALWGLARLNDADVQTLCDQVVSRMVEWTESRYGFYGFVTDDERVMRMIAWSPGVVEHRAIQNRSLEFPLGEAGLWGESVRQRKPVIVNDYAGEHPGKKGSPEGHVELRRVMIVPVFQGERVVGLGGVANKEADYTQEDAEQLGAFLANAQIAVERQQALEDLRRLNVELDGRVRHRTAELEAANRELTILSQMKDQFISNISHELRTPITNVKLREHLLTEHPGELGRHLPVMIRETERLIAIVENLLQLSRLDQGQVDINLRQVDLNALVGEYVSDRQPLARERGLTLVFERKPTRLSVLADAELLGQVVSILLTNALSYTPTGGRIVVSACTRRRKGMQWAGFRVSDTGPGIPLDERPHLFERFFRGRVAYASRTPGTGLGLAIAKEIIERHGGQIEAPSGVASGEGATFSAWLPIQGKASHSTEEAIADEGKKRGGN